MNGPLFASRSRLLAGLVGTLVVIVLAGGLAAAADLRASGKRSAPTATSTTSTVAGSLAEGTATTRAPATTTALPPEPAYVTRIKQEVSQLRGLQWKAPLRVDVVSKAELARRYRADAERDARPDRLAGDGDTFHLLGLIPRSLDYAKTVEGLYSGLVQGFYDSKTKELVVGDDGGEVSGSTKVTLAHELDHALTDQWFDFGARTDALDAADRQEQVDAFDALIEGDAKRLEGRFADAYLTEDEQLEYVFGGIGGAEADKLLQMPKFLLDYLYFPYKQGLDFTERQADARGNGGVDAAYARPPTSTEQVLHPEKYAAGEGWAPPPLPDVGAAAGCQAVRRGTLGEFKMDEILGLHLGDSAASAGADGWNGDSFQTVRCGARLGLVDRWEADSAARAAGLAQALTRWAPGWSGGRMAAGGRFSGPGGSGRIAASGTRVDLVLADDAATADQVGAAIA